MSTNKLRLERFICDKFVHHYNSAHGTRFEFSRHGDAPDLVYTEELRLEITTAYYDDAHARIQWLNIHEY